MASRAVLLAQAGGGAPVPAANLPTWPRAWASVIATMVMLVPRLLATAPPISLGGFTATWKSIPVLARGILLVAAPGEAARRLRE